MSHLKKFALPIIGIAIAAVTLSVFAANEPITSSGGLVTTFQTGSTASGFMVSQTEIVDDRTVKVTFSEALANEPANLQIVELPSDKELAIKSISIQEPERRIATIALATAISSSKQYAIVTDSVRSTGGKVLSKVSPEESISISVPETVPLSPATVAARNTPAPSLGEALAKAKETGSVTAKDVKTVTPSSTSGSSSGTSINTASSPAKNIASNKEAGMVVGPKLPKTGPETWILFLVSIFVGIGLYFRYGKKAQ